MTTREEREKKIVIVSSYLPQKLLYKLDGVLRGEMPKQRYYSSYQAMVEAVEKQNPGKKV